MWGGKFSSIQCSAQNGLLLEEFDPGAAFGGSCGCGEASGASAYNKNLALPVQGLEY